MEIDEGGGVVICGQRHIFLPVLPVIGTVVVHDNGQGHHGFYIHIGIVQYQICRMNQLSYFY